MTFTSENMADAFKMIGYVYSSSNKEGTDTPTYDKTVDGSYRYANFHENFMCLYYPSGYMTVYYEDITGINIHNDGMELSLGSNFTRITFK